MQYVVIIMKDGKKAFRTLCLHCMNKINIKRPECFILKATLSSLAWLDTLRTSVYWYIPYDAHNDGSSHTSIKLA